MADGSTWAQWSASPAPAPTAPYERQGFQDSWGYRSPFGWQPARQSGYEYGPGFAQGEIGYDSPSSFTSQILSGDLSRWLSDEADRLGLNDWNDVTTVGVGQVGVNLRPGVKLGYFTPDADAEIQAAANAYGVPANFLKAIIHKESSGNWEANNTPACGIRGMCIHGYVGVFENAARAWGFSFEEGIGNRAYQINMLASGLRDMYDRLTAQNPQWGWLNVAANHYAGDPTGEYTPGDSYQHGTTKEYMAETQMIWSGLDQDAGNATYTGTSPAGPAANVGGQWAGVERWSSYVNEAAARYGVPANLIKAVMRLESNGNATAISPQGATGLMQVMPGMHGLSRQQLLDPRTNVLKGAEILKANYDQYGSWETAVGAYLGFGTDALGTTTSAYQQRVMGYYNELNTMGGGTPGGGNVPNMPAGSSQLNAVWGGGNFEVSQGHGRTQFSADNPGVYEYSYDVLGYLGHPGIDVSMPVGTPIYTPLPGEVIISGGSGSYTNVTGVNASDSGEVRVRLANGDVIIFGHLSALNVRVGQMIPAGTNVGLSGYPDSPHLHLEVRVPDNSRPNKLRAVDPREYLGGGFSGHLQSGAGGQLQQSIRPMSYQEMLQAAAQGREIRTESLGGGVPGSFNEMLRFVTEGGDYYDALKYKAAIAPSPARLSNYAQQVYTQKGMGSGAPTFGPAPI
jgi:murein DD-endopeptidase MepM/ murein hydrolase activator NlpD